MKNLNDFLCPPGNGVFTVHTAQENKQALHFALYNTIDSEEVEAKWKDSLEKTDQTKKTILLGLCFDTGGGIQRGANWGPLFIRENLIKNFNCEDILDIGDIRVIPHLLHDKYLNTETIKSCQEALYDGLDLPVSPLSIAQSLSKDLFLNDKKLFTLGGDHSVSYPLVKSWLEVKKQKGVKAAVIHFDAHTDLMPKRLGIDICFASWAYHMIELLEKPSHLLQYGIRSSGQPKDYWEKKLGVQQFWPSDFDSLGTDGVIQKTINYLRSQNIEEVYISFDIDALDSSYASSTGTPEHGGLDPKTCIQIIEEISTCCSVTAGDLVEVAPFVSSTHKNKNTIEPDTTVQSAALISQKIIEVMNK